MSHPADLRALDADHLTRSIRGCEAHGAQLGERALALLRVLLQQDAIRDPVLRIEARGLIDSEGINEQLIDTYTARLERLARVA